MSRTPRIDVPEIPQHIVTRGVNRQPCFSRNADRSTYLAILADAAARCAVSVHAFVLMTNHVHLLATGRAPGAVSSMMQVAGSRYVLQFNAVHGRTGTLFEGRFRSSLVQSDRYFLACMRYIELNPVRARLVDGPADYAWSSYLHNAGSTSARAWLTPHEEYLELGTTNEARGRAWQELVASALQEDELTAIRSHANQGRALGDTAFQQAIAARLGRHVHVRARGRPRVKSLC